MGENSVLPVHRGEIQSSHLGCGIECWSDDGKLLQSISMFKELYNLVTNTYNLDFSAISMEMCIWLMPNEGGAVNIYNNNYSLRNNNIQQQQHTSNTTY